MEITQLIVWIIVGGVAGWLAGLVVKGLGFGLIGNIVLWHRRRVCRRLAASELGISLGTGMIAIISAAIGAIIILLLVGLIKRA